MSFLKTFFSSLSLSANEQISILIQERDSAVSNEQSLAERVGELMDEIVRLNEEVTRAKQQKLGELNTKRFQTSLTYITLFREKTKG